MAALLLAAAALRWNNLNWEQGHAFHPDERHILMVTAGLALPFPLDWAQLLSPKSPLNPHSFAYGSLPFYLLKLVSHVLASLGELAPFMEGLKPFSDFDHLRTNGRFLSGLFDLGSVALLYLIGRRLRDRRVGLLAAAFLAFTVINVQYAHFYASDTLVTFFVLAATLFSLETLQTGRLKPALFAGVAIGLALGSKFSAMPVLAVFVMAHLLRLFVEETPSSAPVAAALETGRHGGAESWAWRGLRLRTPHPATLNKAASSLLLGILAAAAVFVIVQPYAVIDFATFSKNLSEQNNMARGVADLPYTRQYANTPAYWYFIWNFLIWGMGLPLGIVVLAGALGVAVKQFLRPRKAELLLLAWVIPYFGITGSFHAKFLRYLIPLTPFLCLLAAYGLLTLRDWLAERREQPVGNRAQGTENRTQGAASGTAGATDEGEAPPAFQPPVAVFAAIGEAEDVADGEAPREDARAVLGAEAAREVGAGAAKAPGMPGGIGAWLRRWTMGGGAERAVSAVIAAGIVGGILYALAFNNIYTDKHTAVRASEWVYQNVPNGARLMTEHWEEGLPVARTIDGTVYDAGRMGYKILTFEGYQPDNPAKYAHIVQRLGEADYIIFFSNRLYSTIPRLPERYPITAKYYELLFGEQLGFKLEAFFTSYPSVLGITLVDETFDDPPLPVPAKLRDFRPSPLTIVAGKADESFSVYDHPKVLVFKKERSLSEGELRALFGPALSRQPREPGTMAAAPGAKSLLLGKAQRAALADGGTFRELFHRDGIENRLPVPVWLALTVVLGLLGLPLSFAVFRNLPDRGYLLARPLGILALAWLNWMLVSLGLLRATRLTAFLALLLLALIGVYFAWRQWPALRAFCRTRWRELLLWESVFWTAFALFLLIRLANPDLWHPARGGEKPMDLAYLMAAIKSVTFPPYDPWFAGGHLNYYYYGQIIVGTLVKLSGILPTTAYNLVVPLLFALTAGGAFSAAYNLVARLNREPRTGDTGKEVSPGTAAPVACHRWTDVLGVEALAGRGGAPPAEASTPTSECSCDGALAANGQHSGAGDRKRAAVVAGASSAVVAVAFGNLGGAVQLVEQLARLGPPPWRSGLPAVEGTGALLAGLWRVLVERRPLPIPTDWYWASTRVLEGTINEFPFFTFLYADLHAHMIGLPFTLLALGLAINLVKGYGAARPIAPHVASPARGRDWPSDLVRRMGMAAARPALAPELLLHVLVVGLAVGVLMPVNSWDFPTYLTLFGVAILMGWYLHRPRQPGGLALVVLKAAGVLVLSYALYWPFHASFQQWYTGVEQFEDKSDVWGYLRIHGFFLFAIVSFLSVETGRLYGRSALLRVAGLWLRHWERLPRAIALQQRLARKDGAASFFALYGIAALLATMLVLHLMGMSLVALLLGLLLWTALLALDDGATSSGAREIAEDRLYGGDRAERMFVLLLIGTGLALSAGVELVAIKGDIGRMNTVFKFYLQVWMLWSVAAVLCVFYAGQYIRARWPRRPRRVWGLLLAVLVAASMVYPLVASRARVSDRYDTSVPMTLDGTAYMARATFQEQNPDTKQAREVRLGTDLPAIRWLQDNVVGTPVILEGWAPLYHWGARYSIYTGLPTVIGWDWHQKQQRWGYQAEIDRRIADVRAVYNDAHPERALNLFAKYDVQYIVVGDLERAVYASAGLAKFDRMVGQSLEVVYDSEGVKIYRRL